MPTLNAECLVPDRTPATRIRRHAALGLLAGVLLAGGVRPAEPSPTDVTVNRVDAATIGTRQIFSSTRLIVSWTPSAEDQAHHFDIVATESVQGTDVRATAGGDATRVTLTGLKASTTYLVIVYACLDEACAESSASASVRGRHRHGVLATARERQHRRSAQDSRE